MKYIIGSRGSRLALIQTKYVQEKLAKMVLVPGMMFTIEPMINQGSPEFYVYEDNGWTVYTDDDGLSAQIEYMVLIKEDGVEVLTK